MSFLGVGTNISNNKYSPLLWLCIIIFLLPGSDSMMALANTVDERAAWIPTSYFPSIDATAMAEFKALGLTRLYVDVWNNGRLYFANSPTVDSLGINGGVYSSTDELGRILQLAQDNSIEVYAWFEYGLMACYGTDTAVVPFCNYAAQQGWILGYSNWQYMDPSNANVINFLIGIMTDVVRNYPALSGVQLDDHFGCPPSLGCTAAGMTSAAISVWSGFKISHSNTPLSLTPAPEGWALANYNVDWRHWIETEGIFTDSVIPQLYRTTYSAFKSELDAHMARLRATTQSKMSVGIRDDGTGANTAWNELEPMIDYANSKGFGVVIWYVKGILVVHNSEYNTKWNSPSPPHLCGDGYCDQGENCNDCPSNQGGDCSSKTKGPMQYCCDGNNPDCGNPNCFWGPGVCDGPNSPPSPTPTPPTPSCATEGQGCRKTPCCSLLTCNDRYKCVV